VDRGPAPAALDRVLATGARIHSISRWTSRVSVEADASVLDRLRREFGVAAVRPVRIHRTEVPEPVEFAPRRASAGWGGSAAQLRLEQLDSLQTRGLDGSGLRILVLDTGFYRDLPVFSQLRVVDEYDFVHGDDDTADDVADSAGQQNHGTGVLSVLAGLDPGLLVGAAPGVEVLLAKTEWVRSETRVEEDNYVAALEWGEALGADLMTASLAYRYFADEPDSFAYAPSDLDGDTAVTTRAVDDLAALGVLCVGAAGNAGPDPGSIWTPADADSILAIAATDSFGVVTSFSSRGPTADGRFKPDLAAMGAKVLMVRPDGEYVRASGTSVAAPLAAGAAALVMQARPEWDPGQVREALRATATQANTPDNALGWGTLRAADAVFLSGDPVYPWPFALLAPADSATANESATFRWTRAEDFQTPDEVDYEIQIADAVDFSQLLAVYPAFGDTQRTLDFLPGGELWWRVQATDPDGHARLSSARQLQLSRTTSAPGFVGELPVRVAGARPNPASHSTRIFLELSRRGDLELEVFDLRGRRVRKWAQSAVSTAGERVFMWDGEDDHGHAVASGTYLLRATLGLRDGQSVRANGRITWIR
jgi:subtilisin family serine protease